ncbi:MAG: twin-arginine translocase subunit TatC [Actinobacteria bacterium]|nr:twin-arginine translocase subunit TatC [Actinomycetota bacterium]
MAKRIAPVDHEQELSVVEHLDELRSRLIMVASVFGLALAVAFWQNHRILDVINRPLPEGKLPSTFGVSEAFMSTMTVSMYGALIVTFPLILWHVYAFVVPAFSENERKVATPLLLMTPVLFSAGVAFGYFLVLPAAVRFLLNFNDDQFNVLVRAQEYYSFFGLTVLAMGLLFELPLAILIATRLGLVTPAQLRANRRYALVLIAVVAMLLPGTDPVSMLIEMVPLLLLYELSIWVSVWFGHGSARADKRKDGTAGKQSAEPPAAVR